MKVLPSEARRDFVPIFEVTTQAGGLPRLPSGNYACRRFAALTHQVAPQAVLGFIAFELYPLVDRFNELPLFTCVPEGGLHVEDANSPPITRRSRGR